MLLWPLAWLVLVSGTVLRVDGVGRETIQNAASGPSCPADPPNYCATAAACSSYNTCTCPEDGNGRFSCYPTGNKTITSLQDQDYALHSPMGPDPVRLLWPCRLRLATLQTRVHKGNILSCLTKVFTTHDVVHGRIGITGVDVYMEVVLRSGQVDEIAFRIQGTYADGKYTFLELGQIPGQDASQGRGVLGQMMDDVDGSGSGDGDGDNVMGMIDDEEDSEDESDDDSGGSWGNPGVLNLPDGQQIKSFIDKDNTGVVEALCCNVKVILRPPGGEGQSGDRLAGLAIVLEDHKDKTIAFKNLETNVVGGLSTGSTSNLTSLEDVLINLALKHPAKQDGSQHESCDKSSYIYHTNCRKDQQVNAVDECSVFLKNLDLVECLHQRIDESTQSDQASPTALQLFNQCMKNSCLTNRQTCEELVSLIERTGTVCQSHLPKGFKPKKLQSTKCT